jgi:hypothetical protein
MVRGPLGLHTTDSIAQNAIDICHQDSGFLEVNFIFLGDALWALLYPNHLSDLIKAI